MLMCCSYCSLTLSHWLGIWPSIQLSVRRLIARCRKVSKPTRLGIEMIVSLWNLTSALSAWLRDNSEISQWYNDSKSTSWLRGYEICCLLVQSFIDIFEKIDRVITASHCMMSHGLNELRGKGKSYVKMNRLWGIITVDNTVIINALWWN